MFDDNYNMFHMRTSLVRFPFVVVMLSVSNHLCYQFSDILNGCSTGVEQYCYGTSASQTEN